MTSFIKVEFMAELLYWITLDWIGVLNEVAGQCRQIGPTSSTHFKERMAATGKTTKLGG